MDRNDQIVLVIKWDIGVHLPGVVGPFGDASEASEWATLNIPNGTWQMHAMAYPYSRPAGRDMRLV